MRILLSFDWTSGGHHPIYVQRFAEALSRHARVVAAVPDETAERIPNSIQADLLPLGRARPLPDHTKSLAPQNREHALEELDQFDRAIALASPTI